MKKKSNTIAIIFIFILMTIMAMVENVRGVFIPIFKDEFKINDTKIGLMLTVSSIGYILFTYIGGILCEKIGQKKVYMLGLVVTVLSLVLLSITKDFNMLLINMFLFNIAISLISIATNTIVPVLFLSFQALLMNFTHFCYGLGTTISQRVSGLMIYKGVPWRKIYVFGAVIFIVYSILFYFVEIPKAETHQKEKGKNKKSIFKNKLLYLYMSTLGFYVFAEIGTLNWFANLMEKGYGFNKDKSSLYLSLFFGIFTFGRLIGGFIVEKFGYLNTVAKFLMISLILYLSGILLRDKGVIVISLAGFFMSITFPTILSTVDTVFKDHGSYATGIIVTVSSTTNMILNAILGKLNVTMGIYNAYFFIPICLLVSVIFAAVLNNKTAVYFVKGDQIGK